MSLGPTNNVSARQSQSVQQTRATEQAAAPAAANPAAELDAHEAQHVPADAATQAATRAATLGAEDAVRANRLNPGITAPATDAPRRGLGIENQEFAGKRSASGRRTAENTSTATPNQQYAALDPSLGGSQPSTRRDTSLDEAGRRSGSGQNMSPSKGRGADASDVIAADTTRLA